MHIALASLMGADFKPGTYTVDLPDAAHTADNPASTKAWNALRGPARVTYNVFADGAIDTTVADLPAAA